eukprot:8525826-Pyramimonas_sp.AAC.1
MRCSPISMRVDMSPPWLSLEAFVRRLLHRIALTLILGCFMSSTTTSRWPRTAALYRGDAPL